MTQFSNKAAFIAGFLLLVANSAMAAAGPTVSFKSETFNVAPGSVFKVIVLIGSNEPVNAINLEVSYSSDIAELTDIDTKNSLINAWQNSPRILSAGSLKLEGGIFQPFKGQDAQVADLVFRALKEGTLNLNLMGGSFYLADGQGTDIKTTGEPLDVKVSASGAKTSVSVPPDQTPPNLEIQIAETPVEKQLLIVFNTEDKESGINYIRMRSREWLNWSDWVVVHNPIPAPKSVWMAELQAVNKQGEDTIKTIYIWPEILKKGALIVFGAAALIGLALMLYNKYKHKT